MTLPIEILLVEDNPHDVELTLDAFAEHHISNRIYVARDGAEAVEYLFGNHDKNQRGAEPPPKLILLDLKLPKIDGLEVLRLIKADERMRRIPVVVLTSSSDENDIVNSYNLGVNSYIVKPVDFEQFTQATRTLGLYWLLLNEYPPT